ncbi:hypothetical protein KOW79_011041 [Hemibagrus wyckioides]|uniref:Protein kinase domain-containing protein n=1 Tax=Hemibagrus wyckioides TaxID=337641 RepID=A0A9D3SI51_9TELE|nr:hypothetical protein KOW79_011041 [Hemibagrus wyckioides]
MQVDRLQLSNDLLQKEAKETEWVLKLCRLLRTVRAPCPNISADWVLPSSSQEFQADVCTVWSLGLLLMELLCGDVPFDSTDIMIKKFSKIVSKDITGQKQTIRVKIQSSQDVKDPAVKAMILKQIYQKLKDHEMAENSTVKWAEQRDGEVFHKKKDNNIGAGNENQQRCDL